MRNTFEKGYLRTLVYKDKKTDTWLASALEFNLTITVASKHTAMQELFEAVQDYIAAARDARSTDPLNQTPNALLLRLWERGQKISAPRSSTPSPYITSMVDIAQFAA